jgi:hypothetical protein
MERLSTGLRKTGSSISQVFTARSTMRFTKAGIGAAAGHTGVAATDTCSMK